MNALTGLGCLHISYWFYAKQPWDTFPHSSSCSKGCFPPRRGSRQSSPTVLGGSSSSSSSSTPAQQPQHGLCHEGRSLTELQPQTWPSHHLCTHPEKSLAASFPPHLSPRPALLENPILPPTQYRAGVWWFLEENVLTTHLHLQRLALRVTEFRIKQHSYCKNELQHKLLHLSHHKGYIPLLFWYQMAQGLFFNKCCLLHLQQVLWVTRQISSLNIFFILYPLPSLSSQVHLFLRNRKNLLFFKGPVVSFIYWSSQRILWVILSPWKPQIDLQGFGEVILFWRGCAGLSDRK